MSSAIGVPIGASTFCGVCTPPPVTVTMRDGERLARRAQALHGERGADVLADVAELAGVTAARHFLARQELHELLLAAGGVDRRHLGELQARIVDGACGVLDGLHRLRLVALDRDDAARRLEHVGQEQRACDDLGGVLAHQHVVAADVGLAFGAVDDQCLARYGRRELVGRRIDGAAEADDAAGAQAPRAALRPFAGQAGVASWARARRGRRSR